MITEYKKIQSKWISYLLAATLFLLLCSKPELLFADHSVKPQCDLFSVSFPTESDGWACGRWGAIYHTDDGGTTWELQETGIDYTLSDLFFTDPNNGWAVGGNGTILNTVDGGKTWKKQDSPVDYYHMGVFFIDQRTGWIASEKTTILYTENGGKTWRVQFSGDEFILKSISFFDLDNGWAVGEYGFIYHTTDGGSSWEQQAGEFGFSEETGDIIGGSFLFDVVAITPETAWVVGIDGYVARTNDGGNTWAALEGGLPKIHLFGVASDRKNTLVISGEGSILISDNGGLKFLEPSIEPPIKYGWIYKTVPLGEKGFVSVGSRGWIYKSDDSGKTWTKLAGN